MYKCENCDKSYLRKRCLWRHRKYECGMEPQFDCKYCPYKSKQSYYLKRHTICKHYELM